MVPAIPHPRQVLGPEALLAVWETAAAQHPLDRALTILRAAHPKRSRDELARLSIGERDGLLFDFHAANFGPRLDAQGFCPQCAGHFELEVDLRQLPVHQKAEPRSGPLEFRVDGLTVACRAPDSYDLAAVAAAVAGATASGDGLAGGRRALLERCVVQVGQDGAAVDVGELGEGQAEALATALAEALEAAEPLADLRMLVTCPACGHVWDVLLDIVDFAWARIERQARRLLSEVDALARAHGWREADVLALSPARRQAYLEMARG